jgi:hypothetical protein
MSQEAQVFNDLLDMALGHGQVRQYGEAVSLLHFDTATVLAQVLLSGQEWKHRYHITDHQRLAQVVRAALDILARDLDRPWLAVPGTHPTPGCERPMTLGDILRLILAYLPDVAPSAHVYADIHLILGDLSIFLRGWHYAAL